MRQQRDHTASAPMTPPMTIAEALAFGKGRLMETGEGLRGGAALREARVLLSAVIGDEPSALLAQDHKRLSEAQLRLYHKSLQERTDGKPMAFIRGSQEFYGLDFTCADSLIPRPDSESVVQLALQKTVTKQDLRVLDLGCGSGCLGIAFAVHYDGQAHVTLADADEGALQTAKRNAERHLPSEAFTVCLSHWCADIKGAFDVIICNPPYIATDDFMYLPQGVRGYEPTAALWGGDDGLSAYRQLADSLKPHLAGEGQVFLEVGIAQADKVAEIFDASGFRFVGEASDLGGIRRALAFGG